MATHDEETLRRFLAARRAGDAVAARRCWEELVTANFDRVRAMVKAESRGRLSHHEQEEALQRALVRLAANMIGTFRGTTVGEWVQATRTLVRYACMDAQRDAIRVSAHEQPLEDDAGRLDAGLVAAIEASRHEQERRADEADELGERGAFLDWAIPQLSQQRRAVVELDRQGVPGPEIQRRLGLSRDVVYATRSRAIKDLVRLREKYTS